MRRFRFLLATVVVALAATGCIRSDLTVAVNDDGSGTYSAIVAFNPKAFADLAEMTGEDTSELGEDPCKELRDSANENKADLPSGATIENYTDGDFCGVKITAPFEAGDNPAEAIQQALGGMGESAEGMSVGLSTFELEKDGNGWRFEATPENSDSSGAEPGDMAMFDSFLKGASSIVRIKLPGRVVEKDSNPDAIDGNGTLIWNLNLMGDSRVLKARTEPGDAIKNKTYTDAGKSLPNVKGAGTVGAQGSGSGGDDGGSSKLPLIIGGVVVVAAIVGFLLWRKSKGKGAPVPSGPGVASMPPTGPPPGDPAAPWGAPAGPPAADPGAQWGAPASGSPEPTAAWAAPAASAPPEATVPRQPVVAPPAAAPEAASTGAAASPGEPQWDAARNAYIVWDAGSSKWMQYDNAAGAWKPIE